MRLAVRTQSEAVISDSGAIAQLGERLHGMQEVSGSIPLSSTKFRIEKEMRPLRLEA